MLFFFTRRLITHQKSPSKKKRSINTFYFLSLQHCGFLQFTLIISGFSWMPRLRNICSVSQTQGSSAWVLVCLSAVASTICVSSFSFLGEYHPHHHHHRQRHQYYQHLYGVAAAGTYNNNILLLFFSGCCFFRADCQKFKNMIFLFSVEFHCINARLAGGLTHLSVCLPVC